MHAHGMHACMQAHAAAAATHTAAETLLPATQACAPEEAAGAAKGPVDVGKRRAEAFKVRVERGREAFEPDAQAAAQQLEHGRAGGGLAMRTHNTRRQQRSRQQVFSFATLCRWLAAAMPTHQLANAQVHA